MEVLEHAQSIFLNRCKVNDLSKERLLVLYKQFKGHLEYIEDVSRQEELLLNKLEEGESVHFRIFAYRFNKENIIRGLEVKVDAIQSEMTIFRTGYYDYTESKRLKFVIKNRKNIISVRDISTRTNSEKKKIIDNFILTERKRKYDPYKMFPISITVFKQDDDDFLCFLSIGELQECEMQEKIILYTLFGESSYEKLEVGTGTERKGRIQSSLYWKAVLKDLPNTVRSRKKYLDTGIGTEIKALNKEMTQILWDYSEKDSRKLKAVLLAVWGIILHKYYDVTDIIMGDVSEAGRLKVIPIRVMQYAKVRENLADIRKQIQQGVLHDVFSFHEMETEINIKVHPCMPVIQNFCELEVQNDFTANIEGKTIYKIESYELPQVPLFIDYNMDESAICLSYSYDRRIYNNNDIRQLHDTFLKLANGMLNLMQEVSVHSVVPEMKKQAVMFEEEAVLQEKISCMQSLPLFCGYYAKELRELAKKCRVADYRMGDTIIANQAAVESLYLVMDGKVEVSRLDGERYLRPLQILKTKAVFGIESLLHDNLSENNYTAYSDTVKLLEIPRDVLREESMSHCGILQELLEIQSKQLSKFQTLWTMD